MARTVTTQCAQRRWWNYNPESGVRLSILDVLYLAIAGSIAIGFKNTAGGIALLPAVALGHFFLFCNVFRIHRRLELIWAGVFVINFAAWALIGPISWMRILLIQTPFTVALIGYEMSRTRYHGIAAKWLH